MKIACPILAACFLLVLPGCIVRRLTDDLAATRTGVERLAALEPTLAQTNARLETSNEHLARAVSELSATRERLDTVITRLDQSNDHLAASVRSLNHLEPMMASLRNLDESLAALRKVIENIDKAIPLIDMSKGTPPADDTLRRQQNLPEPAPAR